MIDKALRSQGGLGGRLGTNLIELGVVDPDTVANALARQKGVPAARRKHFEQVDKSILNLLPKHLAERHSAIPLGVTQKFGQELVVAFMDPDDISAVDEVGFASSMRVRPSVAPEYYMIHYLDRLYGISPRRFLRSAPMESPIDCNSGRLPRAGTPAPRTPAPAPLPRPSVSAPRLSTLDEGWDELLGSDDAVEDEIIAENEPWPERDTPPMLSADDAIATIAMAMSRDEIGAALVAYLMMTFGCGAVLICKKQVALGWRGRFPKVDADTVESISIPLASPSMFQIAAETAEPMRGAPPPEGDDIQRRLWKLLHCTPPVEAVVVPIAIRSRVINLVYAHSADSGPLPHTDRLIDVCAAAAQAYVRLIQAKKGK